MSKPQKYISALTSTTETALNMETAQPDLAANEQIQEKTS